MMHKAWWCLEDVPYGFSRSSVKFQGHTDKNRRFWSNLSFSGLLLQFELTNSYEMMHKARSGITEVPYCFSRSSVKFQGDTAKKSSILTQIGRLRTVTPIRIHWWLWNEAHSLKKHRRGALLFFQGHPSNFKVTQDKKSPILTRIERFRTVTEVWIYRWLWNDA